MGNSRDLPVLLICLCTTSVALASVRRLYEPPFPRAQNEEQSKIYNGSEAKESMPFFVSLTSKSNGETTFKNMCGGSLIDLNHVLTAGHCTEDVKKILDAGGKVEAWLAATQINSPNPKQRIAISDKSKVYTHEQYNKPNMKIENDIGIIELSQPAVPGPDVSPICLKDSADNDNLPVTLVGFGDTKCQNTPSNKLLIAKGTSITASKCRKIKHLDFVQDTVVCATLKNLGNSYAESGPGDSGGPLFTPMASTLLPQYAQIGLVSGGLLVGKGCPYSEAPSFYTIPSKYKSFFEKVKASPVWC